MTPGRAAVARGVVLLVVLLVLALVAALPEAGPQAVSPSRPFADNSAWNSPIPSNAVLDDESKAIADYLVADGFGIANVYEFGVPVYEAVGSTPRSRVDCTEAWGLCDLEREPVPIPDVARPSPGSDGAMVVLDSSTGVSYDFWQARRERDGWWSVSWGGVVDTTGDGYTPGAGQTGAGVPRLAGVVRTSEVEQGIIPHALVFSTDNACRGEHRYPASKTDGASDRDDCIPQGARIQLDPAIDVDGIPDITPGERMVARALQTYGAYAIDNGGARMAFIFENPAAEQDPYPDAGFAYDYYRLDLVPWEGLRVLARWDGT
jgi:hypothetical protein